MHPIAFNLGPLTVRWYGVMMALAFLFGLWTASRRATRSGINGERIVDLGPWLILGAILGARTFYVVSYWREEFAVKPISEIFMIHHGGLVFYGGLLGAMLAGIIYVRVRALPLWKVADILAPSIALGYVFGRFGCLMNGCCHGRVCGLPWAIRFPPQSFAWEMQHRLGLVGENEPSVPVHPTQIYDSLLNLGLYFFLAWLYQRKKFDGQVFAVYLLCYALTRSFVEMFRGDYPAEHLRSGLTPAHLLSIGIFAAGAVLFYVLRRSATRRG